MKLLLLGSMVAYACAQVPLYAPTVVAAPPVLPTMGKRSGVQHAENKASSSKDAFTERQNAWLDWNQGYLSYISDDTYATGLNPIWFGYPDAAVPGAPMSSMEKVGWATVSRSYQIASQNFENQIDRLYHAPEFDHDTYDSLQYNLYSAQANGMAGALEFIDVGMPAAAPWAWWQGYYWAARDAGLALDLAYENKESTHHDIYNAENEYTAANLWDVGAFLGFLQSAGEYDANSKWPGLLTFMATAQDNYNAQDALYHAERKYYDDPSEQTYHELEVAEVLADATNSGMIWGITQTTRGDSLNTELNGYFSDFALYNEYRLAAEASALETEYTSHQYYDKYGNWPQHDNYGLHHRRHHDDHHYYY